MPRGAEGGGIVTASGGNRVSKRILRPLGVAVAGALSAGFLGGFLAAASPASARPSPAGGSPPAVGPGGPGAGFRGGFLPAASPASARPSPAVSSPPAVGSGALVQAYVSARRLPAGAVAGIRVGSLRTASVAGATWAIADFTPAASAAPGVQAEFQDGAGTGIFRQAPGQPWQLVQTGPYGCGRGLPAGLRQAWGLPAAVICQAAITTQRSAASAARSQAGTARTIGQSIANIALGQVGVSVTPAVASFAGLDCDPYSTLVGALSPNANGCR